MNVSMGPTLSVTVAMEIHGWVKLRCVVSFGGFAKYDITAQVTNTAMLQTQRLYVKLYYVTAARFNTYLQYFE